MIILSDTRQQANKHKIKEQWFAEHGVEVIRTKLLCGDYTLPTNQSVSIDTKKDCGELYNCLIQDHARFTNELKLAQECGIKLYILTENKDGITSLDDFIQWKNPRIFMWVKKGRKGKPPVDVHILQKTMFTMQEKYNCEFLFCHPNESAYTIIKLLKGE